MTKNLLIKFFVFFSLAFTLSSSNLFCNSNTGQTNGNSQFNSWTKSNDINFAKQKKSIALILCFFFGELGAHRFYVGKIGTGVLQLLTLGGFYLWKTLDFILILCDKFENSEGQKLCPFGI